MSCPVPTSPLFIKILHMPINKKLEKNPNKQKKNKLILISISSSRWSWEPICSGKYSTCEQMPSWLVLYLLVCLQLKVLCQQACESFITLPLLEMAVFIALLVLCCSVSQRRKKCATSCSTAHYKSEYCNTTSQQSNCSNHAHIMVAVNRSHDTTKGNDSISSYFFFFYYRRVEIIVAVSYWAFSVSIICTVYLGRVMV